MSLLLVPPVTGTTRREFLALLGAAGLLTGCGSGATSPDDTGPATRTVTHSGGTTEIPTMPVRIVALHDSNVLLPLLELGVMPIGSVGRITQDGSIAFRLPATFTAEGVGFLGEVGAPNVEAIAAVGPDLIVGNDLVLDGGLYAQLSGIAPTVVVSTLTQRSPDALLEFADLVGRRAEAQRQDAGYRARIADLRAQLGADLDITTVSFIQSDEPGLLSQADSGSGSWPAVMQDMGFVRPPGQRTGLVDTEQVSLERLAEHDADAVLVLTDAGDSTVAGAVQAMVESPLWATLRAARAGQTYRIDANSTYGSSWFHLNACLDELERILLDPAFRHDVV